MKNTVSNDFFITWLENNILYGVYKNVHLDLEGAKKCVSLRKSLYNYHSTQYPMVIDLRNLSGFTMEARQFLASMEALEGISKCAIIVDSNLSMVLGNIFLKINKPQVQTHLVNSLWEAKEWIEFPKLNQENKESILKEKAATIK